MKLRSVVPLAVRLLRILSLVIPHICLAYDDPRPPESDPPPFRPATVGAAGETPMVYRTRVTLSGSRDMRRLESLGVTVLQRIGSMVLADEQQLEDLARLRFEPTFTDALGTLLETHRVSAGWLRSALNPELGEWSGQR
jgi:hypothetical protein